MRNLQVLFFVGVVLILAVGNFLKKPPDTSPATLEEYVMRGYEAYLESCMKTKQLLMGVASVRCHTFKECQEGANC
jgi:hypothetical protein